MDESIVNDDDDLVIENDTYNLFVSWGLSIATIRLLAECGIVNCKILKMMHSCDVNSIFNERRNIAERITFRYHLQKWRIANNVSNCLSTY